ncbi:molybdopterin-dependent oxidoreductase [Pseudonocardia hispaniensis]|uniref:Molybdopterin-dependent oxidoreductase n=1 Tax=Pseudonocardia hispaniensis TaxID=904933 RepID=A0ABW1J709_9PSEU
MGRRSGRTASHWGSYLVRTEGDEVVEVRGTGQDADPSPIGRNYVGALRHPARIRRPAVRLGWLRDGPGPSGDRGADPYVEISHDEALDLVAGELDRVRGRHGNEAIFGGSYGWGSAGRFHHAQSQVHRFLNAIGGYTRSVNTYSHAAEEVVLPHIVGNREWFLRSVTRWPEVAEHTRLVVAFGGLPRRSVQVNPGGVGAHLNARWQDACAEAGVEFVVVGPSRDDSAAALRASWLPLRPHTDVAMMLAMAHTLLEEGRYDRYFVQHCCVGFEHFARYLRGDIDGIAKTPRWAARICDVAEAAIVELARRLAATRSLITLTWSLQRQHHGEMTYWAGIALAAMAGSMGRPGGGIGTGFSSMHNAHVHDRFSAAAALPQLERAVPTFIPVSRISDMLLNPGQSFDYNGATQRYPDIKLVYWVGGNPFHHHQDLNRLLTAWQRPDTVVVHEPFWNSMAKHADIVFPVATSLEREDFALGVGDPWLTAMDQVATAPEGVVTDYEIFSALARRLGAGDRFTEGRTANQWVRELYERTVETCAAMDIALPDYDTFRTIGGVEIPMRWAGPVAFATLRQDPSAHPLTTPSGKIELFSDTVAGFGYDDCPGYPCWLEPAEWLGSPLAARYPLHLLSVQPDTRLHSQFDHGPLSREGKAGEREQIRLNPKDAADRGLGEGDLVRVFNQRGACLAVVTLSEGLRVGVAQLPTGAWYDPACPGEVGSLDKHGNPNVLTLDIGTSKLAQGPVAHTCLVEVELFTGAPPPVTAHEPPILLSPPSPAAPAVHPALRRSTR